MRLLIVVVASTLFLCAACASDGDFDASPAGQLGIGGECDAPDPTGCGDDDARVDCVSLGGGYCTISACAEGTCPEGSLCGGLPFLAAPICMRTCGSDNDCNGDRPTGPADCSANVMFVVDELAGRSVCVPPATTPQ